MGVDISHDGSIIIYETSWTENYVEKKKIDLDKLGWDRRIHYVTRQGKELWNKKILGTPYLSPDGKTIAIGKSAGEGRDLTILDQNGNLLWKYISRETRNIVFSSDSNYILFSGEGGLQLLDKSGNLLWAKDEERGAITSGAAYIVTEKRVYDKQANIVTEILGRDIIISVDNSRAVYVYPNKVSLLTWPDKTVLKEYIFTFPGATAISRYGHYIVVGGKSAASSNNLFIFDTVTNTSWETKIESKFYFLLTDDGKYLLVIFINLNKLVFYQIY